MSKTKGPTPNLDAFIVRQQTSFTVVLQDGEKIACKLLDLGDKDKANYYKKHGKFDKPIKMNKTKKGWLLTDGYSSYLAAQEMGLSETQIEIKEKLSHFRGAIANILKVLVKPLHIDACKWQHLLIERLTKGR